MTVVAISSLAGCGGALIAPEVAGRLGLPFLDRAIPMETARRLSMDEKAVLEQEEHPEHGFARLIHLLAPATGIYATTMPEPDASDISTHLSDYRSEMERVIREHGDKGAVILGRGAAIVLAEHPRALRVSLIGGVEGRVNQLSRISGIPAEVAAKELAEADHLRRLFIHRLFHADPFDPKHYQLIIDSTLIPLKACANIIVEAARSMEAHWDFED